MLSSRTWAALALLILGWAGGCGRPVQPVTRQPVKVNSGEIERPTPQPAARLLAPQTYTFIPVIMRAQPVDGSNTPLPSLSPQPSLNFSGIDFANRQKTITIQIIPSSRRVNNGKAIEISFIPGKRCVFGDQHACVFNYLSRAGGNVIFISVHSGVGGEAESLRHALEGTWLDRAAFSLGQARAAMKALGGAKVTISQGDTTLKGLSLAALARVPAARINAYFKSPIEASLTRAAASNPGLGKAFDPSQPMIVIETCGWKMAEEPWAEGVTNTTGSVYLGVIQIGP
jgi:hypothetical protein